MTYAVDENGERVNLSKYTRVELKKMKKNKYYCLKCKNRLILKIGERNRPHFSHLTSKVGNKNTNESVHHKLAISLLEKNFKKQKLKTKSEYFIPTIMQRPDIAVFIENESFAFEFQLSNISLTLFRKRTLNLKKAGFKPIWLLSIRLLQMKTSSTIKLTPFISQFIHRLSINHPPQLFFFDPEKERIVILEHILLLSEKTAYAQIRIITLDNFKIKQFKNHSQFDLNTLYSTWKHEKNKFRTKARSHSYGAEYHWRLWLYKQQLHYEALPSIIHLPTRDNYYFKVPPWNWQSRIILQIIHPLKIGECFSHLDCLNRVRNYIIPKTHYPLIDYESDPLKNYLKLLTHLGLIKPIFNNKYVKVENVTFENDLNKSIIADDDILKQLLYNLK